MSAEWVKVARPYAQAAFGYACDQKQFPQWSAFLSLAAAVTQDALVSKLLANPTSPAEKKYTFYSEILKDQLSNPQRNFLKLLATENRLAALPEIFKLYEQFREEAENVFEVSVSSAVPLDETFKQLLSAKLEKQFGKKPALTCDVDPSLIGGLVIRIEDQDKVIDGSIKNQIVRLKAALMG